MNDWDILTPPSDATQSFAAALGFGAMRVPADTAVCRRMYDAYLDSGFNYFDTAYVYENSEAGLQKELVTHHPRTSFLLADKLPVWLTENDTQSDAFLQESLRRCGVDYFDFYLVHSLDDNNHSKAESAGAYAWIERQKEKGLCRHIGFSFHGSPELLDHILTTYPSMEFAQLQLNYIDVLRGRAGLLQEIAAKHNKPIIVMEPIKGGTLAILPPKAEALLKACNPEKSVASWALRYAATLPGVTCVLSGMTALEHVQENLQTFNPLLPLTEAENGVLAQALEELSKVSAIPCTACKYCAGKCPQQIEIPICFSLYNERKRDESKGWNREVQYSALPQGSRAEDCIACGACVTHCPQHIDIPAALADVAKVFK